LALAAGTRDARPADDDAEFTFPVNIRPANRQLNRLAVGDFRSMYGF